MLAARVPVGLRLSAYLLAAGICLSGQLRAHPLAPSLLELHEDEENVRILWKISLLNAQASDLQPLLPSPCSLVSLGWQGAPAVERVGNTGLIRRWTYECGPDGLAGRHVGVEGLERTEISVLLRATLRDGQTAGAILQPDSPSFRIPSQPTSTQVAGSYLRLGIEHILTGFDHLLFVLGLLFLVRERRSLLLTVTAFTLGHSVTLSLAALQLIQLPSVPIELAIGLSIWVLALELTRNQDDHSWLGRRPWRMATLFGLLHGLGFASALAEAGLPDGDIPLALFSFNCGIEAGQLAFILAVLAIQAILAGILRTGGARYTVQPLRIPAAYFIGAFASFWCLQRTADLLTTLR
ncbi:MAG TPA: HupE/UreJ family protein [Acidobacteriota bacterium]|nr:HupE/UreJ family protein [Acidobacteriota bacterium]